jgi:peptidoglycan/LPS O-acetylase OafA/YrhL
MSLERVARIVLLSALGFTAVTSALGGAMLVIGSLVDLSGSPIAIPDSYLAGSPFASTLVPGLALGLVVCGTQVAAFVMVARRMRWAMVGAAIAGFGILVWIFVQMVFIPFSPLQALYFVLGVIQLGAVLVLLDVLHPWAHAAARREDRDVRRPSTVP